MTHEELVAVFEDYLEMESGTYSKPDWFECLSFLAGYFGSVTVDMIMLVRKYQRENKVN